MKILIFGLGSIGRRHRSNLESLRPDAEIIGIDPHPVNAILPWVQWMDWHEALQAHPDVDAAIIASPTEAHLEQMFALWNKNIPFYCEKPIMSIDQLSKITRVVSQERSAVGHQYRFHPEIDRVELRASIHLYFYARDNLIDRYGPTCLETMTNHPIDTALWALGPARFVDIQTDGISVLGFIEHEHGFSKYNLRIDSNPRVSSIMTHEDKIIDLLPDNQMYLDALAAWLRWVEGGERDERTSTIADGLAVMRVMAEVKHVERIDL